MRNTDYALIPLVPPLSGFGVREMPWQNESSTPSASVSWGKMAENWYNIFLTCLAEVIRECCEWQHHGPITEARSWDSFLSALLSRSASNTSKLCWGPVSAPQPERIHPAPPLLCRCHPPVHPSASPVASVTRCLPSRHGLGVSSLHQRPTVPTWPSQQIMN